jgi:hypothetical protein
MSLSADLVNVAVPRTYLFEVYRLIADLSATGRPRAREPETPESQGVIEEWTPKLIRRMVDESQDAMRAILKALADAPDEWVTSAELAKAIGGAADWNTVAGTLGAFGRRCYSRYEVESLPFEKRFDYEAGGKVHRMSALIAKEVLRSLDDAEQV